MLDKTGQTGSPLQLVNGLILMSTFACARLGYGSVIVRILTYNSFHVTVTISPRGFSPVIPIFSNVARGARWALECHFRELHLWKPYPLRAERVLVRFDFVLSLSAPFPR